MSRYINYDALLHKLQSFLDTWEEVPDEEIWEDGELNGLQVREKIVHRVMEKGDWVLMRRITDDGRI